MLGLDTFVEALMRVMHDILAKEPDAMLWNPSKEDGEFFLAEIISTGSFGQMDDNLFEMEEFLYGNSEALRLLRFER